MVAAGPDGWAVDVGGDVAAGGPWARSGVAEVEYGVARNRRDEWGQEGYGPARLVRDAVGVGLKLERPGQAREAASVGHEHVDVGVPHARAAHGLVGCRAFDARWG